MKKLLAIILALVMTVGAVFTMSSCTKDDDTLVCGVTIFENMNEQDENGNWTGFESEFAMEVGKIIGMDVKFQIIESKSERRQETQYSHLNNSRKSAQEPIWMIPAEAENRVNFTA